MSDNDLTSKTDHNLTTVTFFNTNCRSRRKNIRIFANHSSNSFNMMNKPVVHCIFHKTTFTCTYIVKDPNSNHAMVIDPVLDFDLAAGCTSNEHNDAVVAYCKEHNLEIDWIAETHVHADHLTGAHYLKSKFPKAQTAIGENVVKVQTLFKGVFNMGEEFKPDGSQFDVLFKDNQTFQVGGLEGRVFYTPGHTPACISYTIGDALFTGDTLFMPDMGTARCDFPGGSVEQLYQSVQRLYNELPDETRVFVGHDYCPGGREVAWETTLGEEKAKNKQLTFETPQQDFAKWRMERDAMLGFPKLIIPSLQINLRNGAMPPPESNGNSYLKIPLNVLGGGK